jgi:hypothetical protein
MDKNMNNRYNKLITISIVAMIFMSGVAMAAVWTDQLDYTPGSVVTISGNNSDNAGYQSGETVNVHVDGPSSYDSSCSGTADTTGAWSCQITLVTTSAAEGSYNYTAVGNTSNVTQSGTFTDANNVHFTESGLPIGITWNVSMPDQHPSIKTSTTTSTTDTITFAGVSSGAHNYIIGSPISGGVGTQYVALPSSGSVTAVVNQNVGQNINFASQYQVSFAVNPSGTGTINPSPVSYYNSGSTVPISATANTGYVFSSWSASSSAITITSTTSSSTTATINGAGTITANFVLADSTPPTVSITSPSNGALLNQNTLTISGSASDDTGGSGLNEVDIQIDSGSFVPATISGTTWTFSTVVLTDGTHTITAKATDKNQNSALSSPISITIDTTSPTITLLGTNPVDVAQGTSYTDAGATATDDGAFVNVVTSGSVDTNTVGTYTLTYTATDPAGNKATLTRTVNVKDMTPPVITITGSNPATVEAGTTYSDAGATATDNVDSSVTVISSGTVNTNTVGAYTITYSAADKAGNVATPVTRTVNVVDTTPPKVTITAPIDGGFYQTITLPALKYDATDISPHTETVSGWSTDQGTHTVTVTSTDSSNNKGTASVTYTVDNTPPVITPTVTGTSGTNGWYTSDVNVNWDVSDPESGIDSSKSSGCDSTKITTDTDSTILTCSATNKAGLPTTNSVTIKRDATPPVVTASADRIADHNGWYNKPITASFSGTDTSPGSGIDTCDPAVIYISPDSAIASVSGTCKDKAGNVGTGKLSFQYDSTPPTITTDATSGGNPYLSNTWTNKDVIVSFACSDTTSAIDTCTIPQTLSTENTGQTGQSVSGTATDQAGNTATATFSGINIDKTPPIITGAAATSPNSNGWYNTNVIVHFTVSDTLSGIGTSPTDVTLSTEGVSQSATGTVVDNAGNSASSTVSGINIDKTIPATTDNAPPAWQNTDISVSLTCSDSGSGCEGTYYSIDNGQSQVYGIPISITAEGDHTITYYSKDKADNQETPKTVHAKIDKTAPTTTDNAPSIWQTKDFTVTLSCTDSVSGCKQTQYSVDGGTTQTGTSISISAEGDHTITYSSVDNAGNTETTKTVHAKLDKSAPTITITVPGSTYILNQPVTANFKCDDKISGVDTCIGTVANGANIDTSSVGTKTFTVTSTDNAGNSQTPSVITYTVQYSSTSGRKILQPLEQVNDPIGLTKSYKLGSTLPIKFQLTDFNGAYVGSATATLLISKVSSATDPGDAEIVLSGTADTGNTFRYDPIGQQYIFNLKTSNLAIGYSKIDITLSDNTHLYSYFELKK